MFQYCLYKIDNKAYCCWELDVRKRNIEFLTRLDFEYFWFQAELYQKELSGENKHRAAIAIRNIYHHVTETFFTLVCAALQAPYCVYAWMFQATTGDVRKVVRKIQDNDSKLFNLLGLKELSWDAFSKQVYFISENLHPKIEGQKEIAEKYANVWQSMAGMFLNDYTIKEYNAIKHGFRTSSGGFQLHLGPKGTLNVSERHNEWITVGASEFGSSFYVIEKLNYSSLKSNPNYQSKKYFLNWDPNLLVGVIKLIAISINNISKYLKIINGSNPDENRYLVPENDDYFKNYWTYHTNLSQMKFDIDINTEQVEPFTTVEIEKYFNENLKTTI